MILLACSRCEGIKDELPAAWELQDTHSSNKGKFPDIVSSNYKTTMVMTDSWAEHLTAAVMCVVLD